MSEPQITVLENGLTVVTQHVPSRQAALNIAVKAGARHESGKEKGAAHFLEHMMLAEAGGNSLGDIATKTQQMYGAANGSTNYELVDFERQCRTEFVEDAVELLADAVQRPLMDATRMEKERASILREWDESGGNSLSGYEVVQKIAFPASGLEKAIDGSRGQIKRLKPEHLEAFRDKHFTAPNMVLTVVGAVEHGDIVRMAQNYLGDLPARAPATQKAERPAHWRGGIFYQDMEGERTMDLTMGFRASASRDEENLHKDVLLCEILSGQSDNSRLLGALRHEMGAVYDVDVTLNSFKDNGALVISTTADGKNGAAVIEAICGQLATLPDTLTQEELEAHKKSLIGALERDESFNPADICTELAGDVALNGKPASLDARIAAIEALTVEDMQQRAQEVFSSAPSLCIATDCERYALPDYCDITAMLGNERYVDESGYAIEDNAPSTDRAVAEADITAQPAKAVAKDAARGR